jgi:hypothetical protein
MEKGCIMRKFIIYTFCKIIIRVFRARRMRCMGYVVQAAK